MSETKLIPSEPRMCLMHVALADKIHQKFKIVEASEEMVRS